MTNYNPDGWVVLQLSANDYRLFGSWRGGYLYGDSWRCNSGIVHVLDAGSSYIITGYSGSKYECGKSCYSRLGLHNTSVAEDIIKKFTNDNNISKILSEDNMLKLFNQFIKE